MEGEKFVTGDILLELKEAEELDCIFEESTSLPVTKDAGSFFSLICC